MKKEEDRIFGAILILVACIVATVWVVKSQEHREIPVMAVLEAACVEAVDPQGDAP
jgi:hypothetical protein